MTLPARLIAPCLLLAACAAPALVPGARPGAVAGDLGLLVGLGSADADARSAAQTRLAAEPADRQVALLRAGLWLADRANAIACARQVAASWLDAAETARAAELLVADARDATRADALLAVLGSRELAAVLAQRPAPELLLRLGPLVRAGHLPALLALVADGDARRAAAAQTVLLGDVLPVCDQDRPAIAAALLHQAPDPDTTGLPGALRQLIAAWASDQADPVLREPAVTAWWQRWLLAETPGVDDLLALCQATAAARRRSADPGALPVLVRALGFLDDPISDALLRRLAGDAATLPPAAQGFVQAALARRGDRAAAVALEQRAEQDGLALLLLFDAAPPRAERMFVARLLAGTPEVASGALAAWDQLGVAERAWGLRAPRGWQDDLFARALTSGLPGLQLAALGAAMADGRTARVAQHAVAALLRRLPSDAEFLALAPARRDAVAAFLELGAGDEFRRLLRDLAAWPTGSARRTWARATLIRLHDRSSAAAMPAWLDADLERALPDTRAWLAGIDHPALTALLRPAADDDGPALLTWAAHCGLPAAIAEQLLDPSPVRAAVLAAFHAGRPRDGLLRFLAFSPDALVTGIGLVRAPEVHRWLRRFVTARELGRCGWALHELARQGDPAAQADHERGLREGRPAWLRREPLAPPDRRTLPWWRNELGSNRERAAAIQQTLGATLGAPAPVSPLTTPAWCWSELPAEFAWSVLLQRYVPAVLRER